MQQAPALPQSPSSACHLFNGNDVRARASGYPLTHFPISNPDGSLREINETYIHVYGTTALIATVGKLSCTDELRQHEWTAGINMLIVKGPIASTGNLVKLILAFPNVRILKFVLDTPYPNLTNEVKLKNFSLPTNVQVTDVEIMASESIFISLQRKWRKTHTGLICAVLKMLKSFCSINNISIHLPYDYSGQKISHALGKLIQNGPRGLQAAVFTTDVQQRKLTCYHSQSKMEGINIPQSASVQDQPHSEPSAQRSVLCAEKTAKSDQSISGENLRKKSPVPSTSSENQSNIPILKILNPFPLDREFSSDSMAQGFKKPKYQYFYSTSQDYNISSDSE